jgi:hypothetical protein
LAERKKGRLYHRIGLVEIVEGEEKLKVGEQREIIIGGYISNESKVEKKSLNYESFIEIPPKTDH